MPQRFCSLAARHTDVVVVLTAAGLGLDYGTVRLDRTTERWLAAGSELRDQVAGILDGVALDVQQIGSSSVLGLLAKPIVDLAVGVSADQELAPLAGELEATGWIYRGDAGHDGGHLFVLETRPWHRIAQLHAVEHDSPQWRNYVQFRELLRRSPEARDRYETVKQRLAEHHRDDRKAYTLGKSDVVRLLLVGVQHD